MFEQRRGLRRWSFELGDESVRFVRRGPFERLEERVPYEKVPEDAFSVTVASRGLRWAAVVAATLAAVAAVDSLARGGGFGGGALYLAFALVFTAGFVMSRASYVGYRCGEREILFLAATPSREALDAFLDELQRRRRHYLWSRYGALQPGTTPTDELHKIAWLRNQGVITQGELEILKAQVMGPLQGEGDFSPSAELDSGATEWN